MKIASYRSPKSVIRESRISGRGLFARAGLCKGEIVGVKSGHIVTKAQFDQHQNVINEAGLQIADDIFLAPLTEDEYEDVMIYFNHSCSPNVGIRGQIVFVAIRDIEPEEELTLDYATIDHNSLPIICTCGSTECRRLITRDDWRMTDLQRKYGDFFAWHLLEKMHSRR